MCRRILGGERHRHAIARPDQLSRDPMVAVGVMDAVVESGRNLVSEGRLLWDKKNTIQEKISP